MQGSLGHLDNMENLIQKRLEFAIRNKRKIKFRMDGTPIDKYYLFHPYTIIRDKFNDEISLAGFIEKDYLPSNELTNSFRRPTIDSLLEVILEEDTFEPINDWIENFKGLSIEHLVSID